MFHKRTKHIDVKYHFIIEVTTKDGIQIKKFGTSENPVDMMTKTLTLAKFELFSKLVDLLTIELALRGFGGDGDICF